MYQSEVKNYSVSYRYAEGGVIAYDYYDETDWQKVGELATRVVMIAGAAFLMYLTGGVTAPALLPILIP